MPHSTTQNQTQTHAAIVATDTETLIDTIPATSNDIQLQSLAQYTTNNSYPYYTSTSNTITNSANTNTATTNTAYHATNAAAAGSSETTGEQVDHFVNDNQHTLMVKQMPLFNKWMPNVNRRIDHDDQLSTIEAHEQMLTNGIQNRTQSSVPIPLSPTHANLTTDTHGAKLPQTMTELDISSRPPDSMQSNTYHTNNITNPNASSDTINTFSLTTTPAPSGMSISDGDFSSMLSLELESTTENDHFQTTTLNSIEIDETTESNISDVVPIDSYQTSMNDLSARSVTENLPNDLEMTTLATSTTTDMYIDTNTMFIPDDSTELTPSTDQNDRPNHSNSPSSSESPQTDEDASTATTLIDNDDIVTITDSIYRKYTTPPLATIIQMLNFKSRRIPSTESRFGTDDESETETVHPVYVRPTEAMTTAMSEEQTTIATDSVDDDGTGTPAEEEDSILSVIPTQRIASMAWIKVLANNDTTHYIPRFQQRIPILPFRSTEMPSTVASSTTVSSTSFDATSSTTVPATMSVATTMVSTSSESTTSIEDEQSNIIPMVGDEAQIPAPIAKYNKYNKKYDFVIYGILPNNTVVRKYPEHPMSTESPLVVYGILSNGTVVRKYPNGTIVADNKRNSRTYEITDIDPRSLFNPHSDLYRAEQLRQREQLDKYYQQAQMSTRMPATTSDIDPNNTPNNTTDSQNISTSTITTTTTTTTTTSLSMNTTSNVNSTDNNMTTVFKLPIYIFNELHYTLTNDLHDNITQLEL